MRLFRRLRRSWTASFQSTHPVRGATFTPRKAPTFPVFQSTHPVRGATKNFRKRWKVIGISIHAPRAGCDRERRCQRCYHLHFNPRTPCGVRLLPVLRLKRGYNFNPRTPCGVRQNCVSHNRQRTYFNPRTPCGVRPVSAAVGTLFPDFNPRTPCGVRPIPPEQIAFK